MDHEKVKNPYDKFFKSTEETKQYIPDFHCELYDLTTISDDAIKGELILKIQFLLLKYSHNPKFYEKLESFLKLVNEQMVKSNSDEFLKSVMQYLGSVVEESKTEEVAHEIVKSLTGGDKIMATMADKWFQEGIKEGIKEGVKEGIVQGVELQKIDTARKLILRGESIEIIHDITELEISKIDEIRKNLRK